jgi:hypothetical protein
MLFGPHQERRENTFGTWNSKAGLLQVAESVFHGERGPCSVASETSNEPTGAAAIASLLSKTFGCIRRGEWNFSMSKQRLRVFKTFAQ